MAGRRAKLAPLGTELQSDPSVCRLMQDSAAGFTLSGTSADALTTGCVNIQSDGSFLCTQRALQSQEVVDFSHQKWCHVFWAAGRLLIGLNDR